MKINPELLRSIMLRIEELDGTTTIQCCNFKDICDDSKALCYYLDVLQRYGYIEGRNLDNGEYHNYLVDGITSEGREFLGIA